MHATALKLIVGAGAEWAAPAPSWLRTEDDYDRNKVCVPFCLPTRTYAQLSSLEITNMNSPATAVSAAEVNG